MNNKNQCNDLHTEVNQADSASDHDSARWELFRDLIVFQFKLALDGTRDLLLSPVSIITGLFGIFFGGNQPGRHFYALLRWGHKTDRWISLFSAADNKLPGFTGSPADKGLTTDSIVNHIEQVMKDEFKQGGLIAAAERSIKGLIHKIRK